MAKNQKAAEGQVKVRVLVECEYGKCNEVAVIDASLVASLHGVLDAEPAAVEYAESLVK
ncbi:hypothetical protein HHL21_12200 [Massilia sp. RP-1-19]|uniref:Uncharacterized protein n=1 Tax=Massilia polaris TaxID=2728846 RepID=A0A848HKY3_9BURK|nr:hypothetical protein [Massilia polaris]NML61822.1 hypothetical protein [Massilia polaris]